MLQIIGPNAVLIFTGVPGRKGAVEVDTDRSMRNMVLKNQVVFGTVAVQSLVTDRVPMKRYRDLLVGDAAGIKNVLRIAI